MFYRKRDYSKLGESHSSGDEDNSSNSHGSGKMVKRLFNSSKTCTPAPPTPSFPKATERQPTPTTSLVENATSLTNTTGVESLPASSTSPQGISLFQIETPVRQNLNVRNENFSDAILSLITLLTDTKSVIKDVHRQCQRILICYNHYWKQNTVQKTIF